MHWSLLCLQQQHEPGVFLLLFLLLFANKNKATTKVSQNILLLFTRVVVVCVNIILRKQFFVISAVVVCEIYRNGFSYPLLMFFAQFFAKMTFALLAVKKLRVVALFLVVVVVELLF